MLREQEEMIRSKMIKEMEKRRKDYEEHVKRSPFYPVFLDSHFKGSHFLNAKGNLTPNLKL